MATLLERPEDAVSATAMARSFSARLKEVSSRQTDRLVVFKDNQPAAVLMNVQAYQELIDELDAYRGGGTAWRATDQAISHDDMRSLFDRGE